MCNPYVGQLPFRRLEFDKIPRDARGVYGIWYGRHCIYIGKAERQTIAERLKQHWEKADNDDLQTWIDAKGSDLRFQFAVIRDTAHIDCYERRFIKRFCPLANAITYKSTC